MRFFLTNNNSATIITNVTYDVLENVRNIVIAFMINKKKLAFLL